MPVRMGFPTYLPCLVAVAVLGFLLAAGSGKHVARGATGPMPGTGLIRLGSDNWGTLSNTDKYSVIIATAPNANSAGAQPGRALMYACGTNTQSQSTTQSASCGVSFTDAVANNWVLKDASGNYVYYRNSTSIVLLDVGSSSYQQRFVSDIDADLRSHPGIDGLMLDDIVGSLITASQKYPDNASYRAAVLSFIKAVGPALKAKGWHVGVNASILDGAIESISGPVEDGSQWIWWARQLGPYVDAINLEHWQQRWDSTHSVRASPYGAWDGWQRVPGAIQALGKQFYAGEFGSLSDTAKATYLKGSFMLDWNGGGGAFFYADNWSGTSDPWNPAWMVDIGQPSAAKFQVGVGWRRNYSGGTVVVNPHSADSQTFALGATYLTSSGSSVTSVTLSPTRAMILRSTSATTTTTTPTPRPGWSFCAWEGTRCSFSGTLEVSYGANGKFTAPRTFTGGVDCSNAVFGDPAPGARKWCETRPISTSTTTTTTSTTTTPTPRPGWSFCAWEGARCSFSGRLEVSYGANGKFTAPRKFTGGVDCTNAVFGDPAPGARKWCEVR